MEDFFFVHIWCSILATFQTLIALMCTILSSNLKLTEKGRCVMSWQGVPLLYVPLEAVMSKYYGESERLLGTVFSLANELPNGAIIFLDEVMLVLVCSHCCYTSVSF